MSPTTPPNLPQNTFATIESPTAFYDAIEARIPWHVNAQARLDIKLLLLDMRKKSERAEIIHWTWEEQNQFYSKLDELFRNPGEYATTLVDSVRMLVTEEFANELSEARCTNIMVVPKLRLSSDASFNFPMLEDTTFVGLDLHLTFSLEDTVETALSRLVFQYRQKYDAIIIVDSQKRPVGIIRLADLQRWEPDMKLSQIPMCFTGPFPTMDTPREVVERQMNMPWVEVHLMPVIDSRTEAVIGILTIEQVTIRETRFYTAKLDTEIKIWNLHEQLNEPQSPATPA